MLLKTMYLAWIVCHQRRKKHQATSFSIVGGGPAANAAVAISRLGGTARLAARVGDDQIGASIIRDLAKEGVDCSSVRRFSGVFFIRIGRFSR